MKSLRYTICSASLLMASFVMSCQQDILETIPNDRISSDIFWKTAKDAELAANSVYPTLDGVGVVSYDGITDMLISNYPFSENIQIQKGLMTVSTPRFFREWEDAYSGIRRANDFMDNVDRVPEENSELINRLKGEVMTLRAYHYIKLAMLFGDVPLITTGIDIEEGKSVSRTPVEEIWNFIEAELDQAAQWLPLENDSRVSRGTANGLKARAMLFAGRYAKAAAAANEVIQSNAHSLYPDYYELFQYEGENNDEVLLDRQYAKDINAHNIYAVLAPWSQISGSTGSQYVPTAKMIDLYEMTNGMAIDEPGSGYDPLNPYENRDPRLGYSVFLSGITPMPDGKIYGTTPNTNGSDAVQITVYSTSSGFNIRKYVADEDYTDPTNSGLNIILMRYAEILLTYAEAKIELGEIDASVYAAINEVRQRPGVDMPPITVDDASSQSEMREIVRKERTVELAFEGLRLFDLRRWRTAENEIPGVPKGMTYVENGEVKQVVVEGFERAFDPSSDYLWPIPQRERELNSNLSQNSGW